MLKRQIQGKNDAIDTLERRLETERGESDGVRLRLDEVIRERNAAEEKVTRRINSL